MTTPAGGPLEGLQLSLTSILPPAQTASSSGAPSRHLSPGQFGGRVLKSGDGAAEMSAAAPAAGESAGGMAELAPLAAAL